MRYLESMHEEMHIMRYLEKYARMIWIDLDACNEIHETSYWEQRTKSDMHRPIGHDA